MGNQYLSILLLKLKQLEEDIKDLKLDYSISHLQKLQKKLHELSREMGLFGDAANSDLLHQFELDVSVKINNFYYNLDDVWLKPLEEFLKKIKKTLEQMRGELMHVEKRKIIIIEDDEDISKLLIYEFRAMDFEVQNFKIGADALDFLLDEKNTRDVSLLILDRILPDMDGLDILRKISKMKREIPTLIISVLSTESDILSGLQLGAVDYISKPFSVFLLIQKALNLIHAAK